MKILRYCLQDKERVYPVNISGEITTEIISAILDDKEWMDSSGKGDPPPDFYNEKYMMMAEMMSVSDNEFVDGKRVINPTAAKMSEMFYELETRGALDGMNENVMIGINAITDLPTEKDHNYSFYKNSFNRVIRKHVQQIAAYRRNHPNKKLIFIIFDESTAYFESKDRVKPERLEKGQMVAGYPHFWYDDEGLIRSFMNKGIDYIVWFTPYKHAEMAGLGLFPFPVVCIFDGSKDVESRHYQKERMISSEI